MLIYCVNIPFSVTLSLFLTKVTGGILNPSQQSPGPRQEDPWTLARSPENTIHPHTHAWGQVSVSSHPTGLISALWEETTEVGLEPRTFWRLSSPPPACVCFAQKVISQDADRQRDGLFEASVLC